MNKEESRTSMEDSAFDNLEQDFQTVLKELMGDKSLEKFRVEYEKLHRALKKSHDSEKRLMQKCHDLNSEIVVNTTKVTAALKMSQEDRTTITSLKQVHITEMVKAHLITLFVGNRKVMENG